MRGGCSATRLGSLIWVFGGVDGKRKLLNDVYTLDLDSMVWEEVKTRYVTAVGKRGDFFLHFFPSVFVGFFFLFLSFLFLFLFSIVVILELVISCEEESRL